MKVLKHTRLNKFAAAANALVVASLVSGCAVSNGDVKNAYTSAEDRINAEKAAGDVTTLPLFERTHTVYLGSKSHPVSYEATLPAIFKNSTVSFPSELPLSEIGKRIMLATGIPVHIEPEALIPEGAAGETNAQTGSARGAAPMPAGFPQVGGHSGAHPEPVFFLQQPEPLGKYLNALSAALGDDWSFDGKSIQINRFVTRQMTLAVIPGTVRFNSSMNKGTNQSTGTQSNGSGSVGSTTSGSFTSTTQGSRDGSFDPLVNIKTTLDSLKSPSGVVTVDPATRIITMRDTKVAMDRLVAAVDRENGTLTRRVVVRIVDVKIQLNDQSQQGVNTSLIFTAIQNSVSKYAISMTSPESLVTAQGGNLGITVLKPNAPLSTSSAVLTALSQYGKVVDQSDRSPSTMNGIPIRLANFDSLSYLAQTTPAASVVGGTSGGIPGLTPGSVTTGDFINVIPAVLDNNSILLSYTDDNSQLLKLDSQSTGTGATEQLIQLPHTAGTNNDQAIGVQDGQTVVMYGTMTDHYDGTSNAGIGGASGIWNHNKVLEVIFVTPTVLSSL